MLWLIIAVLIIIADQAVKYLVVSGMNVGDTAFSILNLFDITYIQNKGAAFSLLSGKLSLLSIISVAFCIFAVIYWIKKKPTIRIFREVMRQNYARMVLCFAEKNSF